MTSRARGIVAAAWLAVAIAGCGSVRRVTTTVTRSAAPVSTTSTTASATTAPASSSSTATTSSSRAAPNAEAARPPRRIVGDAARALSAAGGYALHGTLRLQGKLTRLAVSTDGLQSTQATIDTGASRSQLIDIHHGSTYLRGNAAFWRTVASPARAGTLAGHWVRLPGGRRDLQRTLGSLSPDVVSRCLIEDHGRLTTGGRDRIGGRPALVVSDDGRAPGASPGSIAVAATGPPYPLRVIVAGLPRPGGRIDVCNTGHPRDGGTGTLTFGAFGEISTIQPPPTAQAPGSAPTV